MKVTTVSLALVLVIFGGLGAVLAAELADKVKVEVLTVGLHPGMDPGMYVCASGHLHIKATVHNLAGVALGPVKVAGKAFGPSDNLLGTATASTKQATLAPNEKAEVNLEFLTVGGPLIRGVKRHELTVIEASAKQ